MLGLLNIAPERDIWQILRVCSCVYSYLNNKWLEILRGGVINRPVDLMSHRGGTCWRTASDEEWNFFIPIWRHFYLCRAPSWLPHPVNPNRHFLYHKTTHLLRKLSLHPIASHYHPHRNGWSVQMMAVRLKFPTGWGRQRSDTVGLVRMDWTLTLRMTLCLFTSLALSLSQKRISERVRFARRWKGSHWLLKRGSKASQSPSVCSH